MNTVELVLLIIATLVCLSCIIPLLTGKKYESFLEPLPDEKFSMKYTYCIGLWWLEVTKNTYRSKWHMRQRSLIHILWGREYSEYYLRIYSAKRLTLSLFTMSIMMCVAMLAGDKAVVLFVFAIIAGGAVYYTYSNDLENQMKEKSEILEYELPEIVSRLALLINAGMILREAWEVIADSGEGEMYKEMKLAIVNMKNGISDYEAIYQFGQRCENGEIRKFTSRILQSLEKGGAHLSAELSQQALEMFELKRQIVTRKADEAAQKTLIPIVIMFIGILMLIMIPILYNMM